MPLLSKYEMGMDGSLSEYMWDKKGKDFVVVAVQGWGRWC
ncbi:hypothetical protein COLO4_11558 [Corchorus olitorius]|uniref:Uncharacterized protein n=1 Tax=Corchorus olitorius TaxID=93759 RepID=A0A1R3K446_9ROSI|nr:hypothetical protein COLO4_11558 [Corchorus olitorius]